MDPPCGLGLGKASHFLQTRTKKKNRHIVPGDTIADNNFTTHDDDLSFALKAA